MLITLTGPSGSGKNTIQDALFNPEQIIISDTTRDPRPGEKNNIDYHFIDNQTFEHNIKQHKYVEHVTFDHHQYGLNRDEIKHKLHTNSIAETILNSDGVKNVLNSEFKDEVMPIILLTSQTKVKMNLQHRQDDPQKIQQRLKLHQTEMQDIHRLICKLKSQHIEFKTIVTDNLNQNELIQTVKNIINNLKGNKIYEEK